MVEIKADMDLMHEPEMVPPCRTTRNSLLASLR